MCNTVFQIKIIYNVFILHIVIGILRNSLFSFPVGFFSSEIKLINLLILL